MAERFEPQQPSMKTNKKTKKGTTPPPPKKKTPINDKHVGLFVVVLCIGYTLIKNSFHCIMSFSCFFLSINNYHNNHHHKYFLLIICSSSSCYYFFLIFICLLFLIIVVFRGLHIILICNLVIFVLLVFLGISLPVGCLIFSCYNVYIIYSPFFSSSYYVLFYCSS